MKTLDHGHGIYGYKIFDARTEGALKVLIKP